MKRREFMGKSCACLGGVIALQAAGLKAQTATAGAPAAGTMAALTAQHLNSGFWSADSIFMSAIKHLEQPEDLVRIATPFGGGMGQKDLCGFLTGGYMTIGLFAGAKKPSDKAARKTTFRLAKEYYDWWTANYPIHCREINKSEAEPCDYKLMGQKASDFLQAMFERESKKG
jgi:C_GCAxxG_C_C family probable redox protein